MESENNDGQENSSDDIYNNGEESNHVTGDDVMMKL
jgi:hypothetical protein